MADNHNDEDEFSRAATFGDRIEAMGLRGESAYGCVDGVNVIDIPAQAIKGRTGAHGSTFSGYLNVLTNTIRVDCAEDPAFWLEIDFDKVTGLAAARAAQDSRAAQQ